MSERLSAISVDASTPVTVEIKQPSVGKRICLLIAIHVVFGMACGSLVDPFQISLVSAFFIGIVFADAGLLAIAAGLAAKSRLSWLAAIAVGWIYLWILVTTTTGPDALIFVLIEIATFATIYLVAIACRSQGWALQRLAPSGDAPASARLQFTISQWMLLTAVVAILLAVLKNTRSLGRNDTVQLMAVYGLCFSVSPLVALWASLVRRQLAARVAIALCLSILPGYLTAIYTRDRQN